MNTKLDLVALAAGVLFAVLGVSGLLNATRVLPHPMWLPAAVLVAIAAAAGTLHGLRSLVMAHDPSPARTADDD